MPLYSYYAKNLKGEEKGGELEAVNVRDLANQLRAQGYTLISSNPVVKEKSSKHSFQGFQKSIARFRWFKPVKLSELMIFSRNLAIMVQVGIPISRALNTLSNETKNHFFKDALREINNAVKKGKNLSESFGVRLDIFSPLYIAMMEAGEKSGKLQESLNILANQMEKDHELIKRIRSAMMYPSIVVIAMLLIGIAMVSYIVPVLIDTFEELGVELPRTTQIIVAISNFITGHWLTVVIGIPVFVTLLITFLRTRVGKEILDAILIRFPLVKRLVREFNSARTARTLSSLISSGVPITSSLEITSHVSQNHYYRDILAEARIKIEEGKTMAEVFKKYPRFYPELLSEMIAVGEETGHISTVLNEIADFYEGEVESITQNLSSVIEPILMIIIGIFVGIFAVSMIQPLYSTVSQGF